ncbi:hypothetical protein [Geomonas anaerohicana]|uniref:DUF5666 domain-containing protein n=1 Tax=Geomonas anaerohicana TaxID=2798583 RepID=A0ABS0Y9P8_9BACT|nr:hypothetical protein [Geomonas anaerohicana]MBJ6749002.1 hypothetical protein [Geomonas anaerohicana]
MSRSNRLFLLIFVTFLFCASTCLAEEEFVGTVSGRNGAQLSIRLPDGYSRSVRITGQTRFFNQDSPVPQRRILPHTLVRIAPKDGEALTITILEAPR